jgi:hypothetical protein
MVCMIDWKFYKGGFAMIKRVYVGFVAAMVATFAYVQAALATTDLDNLFAALDISTFSGKLVLVLVAMIGIAVLFLGYRMGKRALR